MKWNIWRLQTRISTHPKGEQDLPPHCNTSQLCYIHSGQWFASRPILVILNPGKPPCQPPHLLYIHKYSSIFTASVLFPAYIKHQTKPNRKLYLMPQLKLDEISYWRAIKFAQHFLLLIKPHFIWSCFLATLLQYLSLSLIMIFSKIQDCA